MMMQGQPYFNTVPLVQIKGMTSGSQVTSLKDHHVVREPRTLTELEALLKLRYQVFRQSDLAKYVPENELGIDVDHWDGQAHHLGLWEEGVSGAKPLGYLRVIGQTQHQKTYMIQMLGEKYPSLRSKLAAPIPFPIRFMEVFQESKAVKTWFDEFILAGGNTVVEASRLSVSANLQHKTGARSLIETALAVFLAPKMLTYGVMEVMEHHVSYYQRYGFMPVASRFQPDIQRTSYLIAGHYASTPDRLKDRFASLSEEWTSKGFILSN